MAGGARARGTAPSPAWGLLAALLLASCATGSHPEGPRPDGAGGERKSVLVGELLAIFPGFFVHGAGHRYAGNDDRADELLAMELYSFLPAALGGALYGVGVSEDLEAVEVAGLVGMGVGAIPFLGTWIYDMVYTPSEVERWNRRVAAEGR